MFRFEPQPKTIFSKIVLGCLVCFNILAWVVVWDLTQQRLEVVFFDVGQGDSIFIETPERVQVLIDGGPDLTVLEKLAEEMPFYDRTIDLIILTHPDHDHIFGLLEVLKRYKIKNILWTGVVKDTPEWDEWNRLIEEEGAEIEIAQAGQRIILERSDLPGRSDLYILVLHPFESLEGQEFKYYNDTSIVAKLISENVSFLFPGDISKKIEKQLVDVDSDILKVAHHGSKFSSSEEFLRAVSPEKAVISVGENNYGQPHLGVLANLEKFAIQVLRTDELGDIEIFSDGKNLKLKTQNSKRKTTTQN